MSDDTDSQVPTDEPKVDDTVLTKTPEVESEEPSGPQPLYKDDEPADQKEDTSEQDDEASSPEDQEKETEKPEDKDGGDDKDYESLDAPEDSLLSDSDMERILDQAKQEGLSKEEAQKNVEFANEILKANRDRISDAHSELSEKWIQECKDDKEIGGEKFEESVSHAQKALKKFGTEAFMQSLNETKFGNNPEVVRVFARIGRAMSPDEVIVSGVDTGGERTYEDVFYGGNKTN